MDDLISDFTAESREMLAALDGEVVAWEAAPEDGARLDAIFRFVHTIKGNSGFSVLRGALGGELVAGEAAPEDGARLDAIFRFVHTIKGNSGFFDLPRLTALSHAAEEALAQARPARARPRPALAS